MLAGSIMRSKTSEDRRDELRGVLWCAMGEGDGERDGEEGRRGSISGNAFCLGHVGTAGGPSAGKLGAKLGGGGCVWMFDVGGVVVEMILGSCFV